MRPHIVSIDKARKWYVLVVIVIIAASSSLAINLLLIHESRDWIQISPSTQCIDTPWGGKSNIEIFFEERGITVYDVRTISPPDGVLTCAACSCPVLGRTEILIDKVNKGNVSAILNRAFDNSITMSFEKRNAYPGQEYWFVMYTNPHRMYNRSITDGYEYYTYCIGYLGGKTCESPTESNPVVVGSYESGIGFKFPSRFKMVAGKIVHFKGYFLIPEGTNESYYSMELFSCLTNNQREDCSPENAWGTYPFIIEVAEET